MVWRAVSIAIALGAEQVESPTPIPSPAPAPTATTLPPAAQKSPLYDSEKEVRVGTCIGVDAERCTVRAIIIAGDPTLAEGKRGTCEQVLPTVRFSPADQPEFAGAAITVRMTPTNRKASATRPEPFDQKVILQADTDGLQTLCLPVELKTALGAFEMKWLDEDPKLRANIIGSMVTGGALAGMFMRRHQSIKEEIVGAAIGPVNIGALPFGAQPLSLVRVSISSSPSGLPVLLRGNPITVTDTKFKIANADLRSLAVKVGGKVVPIKWCKRIDTSDAVRFACEGLRIKP